jgi:hypothetical protein
MASSPGDLLTTPQPTDPVPDLVENILGASQYISISYWLGWAAQQVCGTNPWQWIAEQYAGDWKAVQAAGLALEQLGKFNTAFAKEIDEGAADLFPAHWQGNAAESAQQYFSTLTQAINDQVPDLEGMGGQFKTMAVGMYETANGIKGLWEFLLDLLIAIGLEAAAAAATSWTVIGPIISGAAAAATIAKAIGVWGQILEAHNHAWNAVQAFTGIMAGYLGGLDDLNRHALPAGSYDHPAV